GTMGTFALAIRRILLFFSIGVHWIRAFFPTDNHLHRARFANTSELSHLLTPAPPADGLLLGRASLRSFVTVQPKQMRRELGNLLIVGPTRSGKGLLATSQLLSWHKSVIVNDIKGELFTATAGYRSTLGDVYVIDPTGIGHCFDPLHGKKTEDEFFSAAAHLLFRPDEGDGAIFTQRATVMLTQLFLAARVEGIAPFPYARSLIRSGLADAAAQLNYIDSQLATQFLDVSFANANLSDRFLLSAWGTLAARMRPLLTETVIRCFMHSDFTPEELMRSDRPVTVYFRWKEQDLLALSPLVRLLWGALMNELITTYDKTQGQGCNPVLLLIDEAGRTAIPMLADQATTVVGRGVSLWVAVQSLSQLETEYGKARAQVLRDNMESQIYYRPTDLATARYLEERLGTYSAYAHSTTARVGAETSEGLSERPLPLLTAQEILQLKDDEVLGFHRRLPPFRIRRIDWRTHALLTKRAGMSAPTLSPLPEVTEIPMQHKQSQVFPHGYIDPDNLLN
ncbi:MAG: type IV secretory system conjugative DNA transfer family protein, partial [Ktedonobacteraceae bacterium]